MTIDLTSLASPAPADGGDLIAIAAPVIDAVVARRSMGDALWWSLAPTLMPTQNGVQAIYVVFVHMRSPLLGSSLSSFVVFENPLDLLNADTVDAQVGAAIDALFEGRSAMLAQGRGGPTIDVVSH